MAKEERCVISVISRDDGMDIMTNGTLEEIIMALEYTIATMFVLKLGREYSEDKLYRFLELHCASIKELVEEGCENGD